MYLRPIGICLAMSLFAASPTSLGAAPDTTPILLAQTTAPAQKPADTQGGGAVEQPGRNWLVSCSDEAPSGGSQCRMVQNLLVKESNQRLLTVVVQKVQGAEQPLLIIGLPHGVYLPAGVSLSVDEGVVQKIVVQTSDANGAYATAEIDDKFLAVLRAGATLNVVFEARNKKPLTIPVTLNGFSEAFQRVDAFGG